VSEQLVGGYTYGLWHLILCSGGSQAGDDEGNPEGKAPVFTHHCTNIGMSTR